LPDVIDKATHLAAHAVRSRNFLEEFSKAKNLMIGLSYTEPNLRADEIWVNRAAVTKQRKNAASFYSFNKIP
jgi:hypothetical protein